MQAGDGVVGVADAQMPEAALGGRLDRRGRPSWVTESIVTSILAVVFARRSARAPGCRGRCRGAARCRSRTRSIRGRASCRRGRAVSRRRTVECGGRTSGACRVRVRERQQHYERAEQDTQHVPHTHCSDIRAWNTAIGSRSCSPATSTASRAGSARCTGTAPCSRGPAVGDDYKAPFRCNVPIRRVVVDVVGEHDRDPMAVFQALMSEQ